MDSFDGSCVLAAFYCLAAGFVLLLGNSTHSQGLLVFAIFGAGIGAAGSQVALNALAASYYHTASRATGVS
jgi:MFS transporter, AAHS family, 4-hydroxybenzoate transporter